MHLSALIEKIAGKQKEFMADFDELVCLVADGKQFDPEVIARALQDAGKTVDDLQRAVGLIQQRRGWRKTMEKMQGLDQERAAIRRQIDEADRALADAEQRHENTTHPLYSKLEQIKQVESDGEEAKRKLQETCADGEVLRKLAHVSTEKNALVYRRVELRDRSFELRRAGQADLARDSHIITTDNTGLRERGEQRLAAAKECEKEVAILEKEIAKLEQQERAIQERMLVP